MWTLAERFNALDCGSRVHQFESGTPTFLVPWCNGSTSDFLSENEGSTPSGTDFWRDGREAECGSMLSCYSGNAIGGSNPSLSAIWKAVITGSRPDLKSGVPQGIGSSSLPLSVIGELAQWLVQRTVNPPIQVRFLYSPYLLMIMPVS